MSVDVKEARAHFVLKIVPQLKQNGMRDGGAYMYIRNHFVLGLRFKPAPVFHFLGKAKCYATKMCNNLKNTGCGKIAGTCLKRAKSENTALCDCLAAMGGDVW